LKAGRDSEIPARPSAGATDLVITAHEENETVQDANLYDELCNRGWPDAEADKLASDFEKGRDLLEDYDKRMP
jgi:hypothetical protein